MYGTASFDSADSTELLSPDGTGLPTSVGYAACVATLPYVTRVLHDYHGRHAASVSPAFRVLHTRRGDEVRYLYENLDAFNGTTVHPSSPAALAAFDVVTTPPDLFMDRIAGRDPLCVLDYGNAALEHHSIVELLAWFRHMLMERPQSLQSLAPNAVRQLQQDVVVRLRGIAEWRQIPIRKVLQEIDRDAKTLIQRLFLATASASLRRCNGPVAKNGMRLPVSLPIADVGVTIPTRYLTLLDVIGGSGGSGFVQVQVTANPIHSVGLFGGTVHNDHSHDPRGTSPLAHQADETRSVGSTDSSEAAAWVNGGREAALTLVSTLKKDKWKGKTHPPFDEVITHAVLNELEFLEIRNSAKVKRCAAGNPIYTTAEIWKFAAIKGKLTPEQLTSAHKELAHLYNHKRFSTDPPQQPGERSLANRLSYLETSTSDLFGGKVLQESSIKGVPKIDTRAVIQKAFEDKGWLEGVKQTRPPAWG